MKLVLLVQKQISEKHFQILRCFVNTFLQVTYLMTVIQFCGRPSTLPLTNQLQPSTSKTDKKLLRFFKKFWDIKKASASTLETEVIFQYTKSVVNAKTAAPDYSDAAVKLLQMCDFTGVLPISA